MGTGVAELKQILEQRFPDAVPAAFRIARGVPTGLRGLDALLPGGGFPRGRLSVWRPGAGATAALRAACAETVHRGERAAWIDAANRTAGDVSWLGVALLRPAERVAALASAEELLRCGGFALVVLTGIASAGADRVRLCRAAREGGGAFVEVSAERHTAAVRLRSSISPEGYRWTRNGLGEAVRVESATVRVRVSALGWSREAEVVLPVEHHAIRLSLEPALVSRRGSAR